MEALHTKYRPKDWEAVYGQDSVKKILQKQIETGNIRNAYLFVGNSGCGKTTCARIFANKVNKERGTPIEIDAASNSGVDNVRNIVANASERALDCTYKVIIIDECFTEDTVVETKDGRKKIKDVTSNDLVVTPYGYRRVLKNIKHKTKTSDVITVNLSNNKKINVTKNHLFLTTDGWVQAQFLKEGDELVDVENLPYLWEGFSHEEQDLFCRVW